MLSPWRSVTLIHWWRRRPIVASLCVVVAAWLWLAAARPALAGDHAATEPIRVSGAVVDAQGLPVFDAEVWLAAAEDGPALAVGHTQPDGRFVLPAPADASALYLIVDRAHFENAVLALSAEQRDALRADAPIALDAIVLERQVTLALWLAAAVFVVMLVAIAVTRLHNALIALAGAVFLLAVSPLGRATGLPLFIFDFERSLTYVDWNVIFLVMGMMMYIAVIERTGLFQWLAFQSYRLSGGRMGLLLVILMAVTGVASAFLDNVTTMLLIAPITIQIALTLEINPLALLLPEVMASNVIGVSTLVGTPTNILIGSAGAITFNDFLFNLTPGVLLAFAGLVIYCLFVYRRELSSGSDATEMLLRRLERRARIDEPEQLRKAGIVGAAMLLLFVFGESIHFTPAITALLGATAVMLWTQPNVEEMIDAVDWTTLVFFIALFIVIGAIQEVGLISLVGGVIGRLVGDSLLLALLAVVWLGAFASAVVANIPFTAAMLPIIGFLTGSVPGAESKALYYALSVGSAMGGNGSLIGASANLVTAGIAEQAGYPITYRMFLRHGLLVMVITVSLASLWLIVRFVL